VRILITGGTGYIGSYLFFFFKKLGYDVLIASRKNYDEINWIKKNEIIKYDLNRNTKIFDIINNVDLVIHSAGMNHMDCNNNPEQAINFNYKVTIDLIEESIRNKVKNFIFLSTYHVYKSDLSGTLKENSETNNTHSYAVSKSLTEKHLLKIYSEKKIKGTILRLSNIYGVPVSKDINCWHLFINDFCKQVIINKSILIKSNFFQERNILSLKNLALIINNLINKKDKIENFPYLFNIGSNLTYSLKEVAETISKRSKLILGYTPSIILNDNFYKKKEKLIYDIELMQRYHLFQYENLYDEIDSLLLFCKKYF